MGRKKLRSESGCDEERICVALFADASERAVAGVNDCIVGELHEFAAERVRDLIHGAAPEIGAADTAGEKRVASEEARRRNSDGAGVFGQIEANAAGRVAGRMNDVGFEGAPIERVAFFEELIDISDFRSGNA